MEEKYRKFRKINSAQIIYHNGSHAICKYCLEDTLRRFKIKEDEMIVKISSCDAMYMKKCSTADAVLAKSRDPEKTTA